MSNYSTRLADAYLQKLEEIQHVTKMPATASVCLELIAKLSSPEELNQIASRALELERYYERQAEEAPEQSAAPDGDD